MKLKYATRSIAVMLAAISLGAAGNLLVSRHAHGAEHHHTVVSGDEIKWGAAPPSLPPGAQAGVLLGSPAKEGPFVLRLKFPPGFIIPPHRHTKDEFVTVISGRFAVASGETVDRESLQPLIIISADQDGRRCHYVQRIRPLVLFGRMQHFGPKWPTRIDHIGRGTDRRICTRNPRSKNAANQEQSSISTDRQITLHLIVFFVHWLAAVRSWTPHAGYQCYIFLMGADRMWRGSVI